MKNMKPKILYNYTNYLVYPEGKIVNVKTGRVLKRYKNNCGYISFKLSQGGNIHSSYLHIAVATLFVNNPDNLPEVNHKDGDKENCHFGNLEWVTHQQNIAHSFNVLGRLVLHNNAKKKPVQQIKNGEVIRVWQSMAEAELNGFKSPLISFCLKNPHRTHRGCYWSAV